MTAARKGLSVLVDGVALPPEEARALWQRFSDWMEEHRGDLAGFAAREGFTSVHPGVDRGEPVLIASRTAPQRPYGPARAAAPAAPAARSGNPSGGSENRHRRPGKSRPSRGKTRN